MRQRCSFFSDTWLTMFARHLEQSNSECGMLFELVRCVGDELGGAAHVSYCCDTDICLYACYGRSYSGPAA